MHKHNVRLCSKRNNDKWFPFQLRCCGAQIAETETSQIAFGKRIASKKTQLIQCDGKIDALKEQKVQLMRRVWQTQRTLNADDGD